MVNGHVISDVISSKAKGKWAVFAEIEQSEHIERNGQAHLEGCGWSEAYNQGKEYGSEVYNISVEEGEQIVLVYTLEGKDVLIIDLRVFQIRHVNLLLRGKEHISGR